MYSSPSLSLPLKSSLMPKLHVARALSSLAHFLWSYPIWTQRSDNFLSSPWQPSMCLKKHIWRLTCVTPLYFSAENNLGSSCLSSESGPPWLFLELWLFLLFSWNSAISSPSSEVRYPKIDSARMRKRHLPCQTLPLWLSMVHPYGKAPSATAETNII